MSEHELLDDSDAPQAAEGVTSAQGERSVTSLLRDIQQGGLDAKSLSLDDRRACVEHLTGEGFSVAEICEILRTPRRTIARDREAIRRANSLKVGPNFALEVAGELIREAETCITRARRAVRNREATAADKLAAERDAWTIRRGLVQILQRLGLLPEAAQSLRADLTHHVGGAGVGGESPDSGTVVDMMGRELERLNEAAKVSGADSGTLVQIEQLRHGLKEVRIARQLECLAVTVEAHELGADPEERSNAELHK